MNEPQPLLASAAPAEGSDNKMGGDFVSPDASFEAKRAILAGRALLYANKAEALKRAITGGNSLVDGASPIVAMIVAGVEQKLGELSDEDLQVVAFHLSGTIVEVARDQGDPEALDADGATATRKLTAQALAMLQGQGGDQPPEDPMQAPEQAGAPLLASAQGDLNV